MPVSQFTHEATYTQLSPPRDTPQLIEMPDRMTKNYHFLKQSSPHFSRSLLFHGKLLRSPRAALYGVLGELNKRYLLKEGRLPWRPLKSDFISDSRTNVVFCLTRFRLSISRPAVPSACMDCCGQHGGCSSKFYYGLVIELNRFTFE